MRRSPILHLEVIGSSGRCDADRVFCRERGESLTADECRACPHFTAVVAVGELPMVECTASSPPIDDPDGNLTTVGSMLERGAIALEASATLAAARALLGRGELHSIAIVDGERMLIGRIDETSLALGSGFVLDEIMSSSVAILETTTVRCALRVLASRHLREATVVTRNGVPVGTFRDVDGLRFIGHRRR